MQRTVNDNKVKLFRLMTSHWDESLYRKSKDQLAILNNYKQSVIKLILFWINASREFGMLV